MPYLRPSLASVLATLGLALLAACSGGRPDELPIAIDLAAQLPYAEVRTETASIDFTAALPPTARGFYPADADARWSRGEESSVDLYV
ncbi:MAG TPA: hypothetical protein VKU40_15650, partial [Thermoanaerobaculia bacterium]|nr:hypothetical protein [Thermoanaerobaculia bacterium]